MGSPRAPEPAGSDGGTAPLLRLDRAFQLGAATTFLVLLLASELLARAATSRHWLYERFDFSGGLTSLPELEDRIRWAGKDPRPVFLIGDSVLGATALLERGEVAAREKTFPRALQGLGVGRVVSLAADGLLPLDVLGIARTLTRTLSEPARIGPPPGLVVVVNFRMLAKEHEAEGQRLSRPFLSSALATGERPAMPAGRFEESSLSARLFEQASSRFLLFRNAQLLRTLWYFPTQRDRFQRVVESALGRPELGDLEEAALRMRVMPFYREPFRDGAPALAALQAALLALRAAGEPLVVLSPQNPDVLAEAEESVATSRRTLRDVVARAGVTRYVDLADRFGASLFLDHCHLTAEGNRRFAEEVAARLGVASTRPPDAAEARR